MGKKNSEGLWLENDNVREKKKKKNQAEIEFPASNFGD